MIRVLIVEDESLIAAAHRDYLGRIGGFEVVGAVTTAQEALRTTKTHAVDLVLLDLGLPDARGGTDLASALAGGCARRPTSSRSPHNATCRPCAPRCPVGCCSTC